MVYNTKFYIDGAWVTPDGTGLIEVIDPSTERVCTSVAAGNAEDVDRAVRAARKAFRSFGRSTKEERLALLRKVLTAYERRSDDLGKALTQEMGAPVKATRGAQVWVGKAHLEATIRALEQMEFSEKRGTTMVVREPIGVCALITPWNWPMNQIVCKVAPAIGAGCTVVLKPSEVSPISGLIFAEIMDEAGCPPGVFNLLNGTGFDVGQKMAEHPEVDMVSFTGSTRAGVAVALAAAPTIKRVSQELGGKSPNIILDDADFPTAVAEGVAACFGNSGQTCSAPTRMLVPADRHDEAMQIARAAAERFVTGDPNRVETDLGPVVSAIQYEKIQRLIEAGIAEGAQLVSGGPGRPAGLNAGYYIRPTIFGGVTNDMTIAREEVFGPVLALLPYEDEENAIEIANETVYGLTAYVQSGNLDRARRVAAQLRAGAVHLNYPTWDATAPFGGYKQSGNGREYADWGLHDFLEIKGIVGYDAA